MAVSRRNHMKSISGHESTFKVGVDCRVARHKGIAIQPVPNRSRYQPGAPVRPVSSICCLTANSNGANL